MATILRLIMIIKNIMWCSMLIIYWISILLSNSMLSKEDSIKLSPVGSSKYIYILSLDVYAWRIKDPDRWCLRDQLGLAAAFYSIWRIYSIISYYQEFLGIFAYLDWGRKEEIYDVLYGNRSSPNRRSEIVEIYYSKTCEY